MCYDDQARPPEPPGSVGKAQGEDIVLTAQDGNKFAAYSAVPAQTSHAHVIIYPDVRGLHQFYKELALRFAEVGVSAVAIDYFGRTAGLTAREESFEFWPHVQQLKLDAFEQDVQAALTFVRASADTRDSVFVVGFCMGGAFALQTGTNKAFGFAGLIPFYAALSRDLGGRGTVLDNAQRVAYPVVGFFGGADEGIPQSDIQKLDDQLDASGVEHKLIVYPGAPHSFFDRRSDQFAEASTDAWQHVLEFIKAHTV